MLLDEPLEELDMDADRAFGANASESKVDESK